MYRLVTFIETRIAFSGTLVFSAECTIGMLLGAAVR